MEIIQHIWGFTDEGDAIVIYTMTNSNGASVQVTNYGASIVSITVPDREGNMRDVALGYGRWQDYLADPHSIGRSIGRYAGRISKGRFTLGGNEYTLAVNSPPNHLNGGFKGFHTRIWESRVEGDRVVFAYQSTNGEEGYPGELSVEACFDWDDDYNLEITYFGKSEAPTIVNQTSNLYFNLKGEGNGTILDHQLQINAKNYLPLNPLQIPTGEILEVAGTPMDFTQERVIGERINEEEIQLQQCGGYDHSWAIDGYTDGETMLHAATLYEAESGREVKVFTTQPALHLSTGNWLQGTPKGKGREAYVPHSGLILSCQAFPDAPNHPDFPSTVLTPDKVYEEHTLYRFGVRNR